MDRDITVYKQRDSLELLWLDNRVERAQMRQEHLLNKYNHDSG